MVNLDFVKSACTKRRRFWGPRGWAVNRWISPCWGIENGLFGDASGPGLREAFPEAISTFKPPILTPIFPPPPICPENLQNLENWAFRFFGKSGFRQNRPHEAQARLRAPELGLKSMDLAMLGGRKRPLWRRARPRPPGGVS